VRADQFQSLESGLKNLFKNHYELPWRESAAFCLYGAVQFCRSHESGPWKWEEICTPIGFKRSRGQLVKIVREGLQWWGRHLLRVESSNRYLTTLVCEGGLPLKILHRQDTAITRFLRSVLKAKESFRDLSCEELIPFYEDNLPKSLQNDIVRELSAKLVEAVKDLRTPPIPEGVQDPLLYLDDHRPGWRNKLPLSLEDSITKKLLGNLLTEKLGSSSNSNELKLEAFLVRGIEGFRLERELHFSPLIEESFFLEAFGCENLLNRFELSLVTTNGIRCPVALAHAESSKYRLERRGRSSLKSSEVLEDTIELAATLGSRNLGQTIPAGGSPLGEIPWVFTDDERPRLIGRGTTKTRHKSIIVVLPEDSQWSSEGEFKETGLLYQNRRRVIQGQGLLIIESAGDRFRIRSQSTDEESHTYLMTGRRRALGYGGTDVFLGLPCWFEISEAGRSRVDDLQWKAAKVPGEWRTLNSSNPPYGEILVRSVKNSETLFRDRLTVFPGDFTCTVETGQTEGEGRIILSDVYARSLDITSDEQEIAVESVQSGFVLTFQQSDNPLFKLDANFLFPQTGPTQVKLGVPIPCKQFVGPGGQVLNVRERVSVDQLYGIQARAVSARKAQFRLEAYGLGKDSLGKLVHCSKAASAGSFLYDLSLDRVIDQINVILAKSPELDASIT
ncbi:MAG: STY4851/ECs_5259 family protein, partial [Planctomycetota bacterium]|nr:STY4851/ECs_5259 family protein [Planctomycetota bacterium]